MRFVFQWTWTSCSTWFRWRSRTRWNRKPWRWCCSPLRWWHKEEYAITFQKDLQDTLPTRLGCHFKLKKKKLLRNFNVVVTFQFWRHFSFMMTFQICLRESYFVECHRWSINTEYKQNWSVLQENKKTWLKKKTIDTIKVKL